MDNNLLEEKIKMLLRPYVEGMQKALSIELENIKQNQQKIDNVLQNLEQGVETYKKNTVEEISKELEAHVSKVFNEDMPKQTNKMLVAIEQILQKKIQEIGTGYVEKLREDLQAEILYIDDVKEKVKKQYALYTEKKWDFEDALRAKIKVLYPTAPEEISALLYSTASKGIDEILIDTNFIEKHMEEMEKPQGRKARIQKEENFERALDELFDNYVENEFIDEVKNANGEIVTEILPPEDYIKRTTQRNEAEEEVARLKQEVEKWQPLYQEDTIKAVLDYQKETGKRLTETFKELEEKTENLTLAKLEKYQAVISRIDEKVEKEWQERQRRNQEEITQKKEQERIQTIEQQKREIEKERIEEKKSSAILSFFEQFPLGHVLLNQQIKPLIEPWLISHLLEGKRYFFYF